MIKNKKGEWTTILSKRNLSILIGALLILIFVGVIKQTADSLFQENQKEIIGELKGKITDLTSTLESIRSSILLLNENMGELQKTKANEDSIVELSHKVDNLTYLANKNSDSLVYLNERVNSIENTLKVIEPSYVQNIDTRDFRTYFNVFNFRLVINFFIALTLSLFAMEFFKLFGDFISYGYKNKSYNIKKYWNYRFKKENIKIEIKNTNLENSLNKSGDSSKSIDVKKDE